MMVVAGAVAQNVWAGENPAPVAAPDEESATAASESAASTSQPTDEGSAAPGKPSAAKPAKTSSPSWGGPAEANHFGQGGISIMPGTGYRVIVPYGEIWCGDSSSNAIRRVCTHMLPFFLDLQLSYGLHPRLDFIVDLRFALQQDPVTYGVHEFALAPGVRYWLDQGVALKFYATGQAIYDYVDYPHVSKSDFALRNADGIMYDAIRNVGFFFQVGWTMGFTRWFRLELDTGLGVQVRFP
jgi:hypothetical protein